MQYSCKLCSFFLFQGSLSGDPVRVRPCQGLRLFDPVRSHDLGRVLPLSEYPLFLFYGYMTLSGYAPVRVFVYLTLSGSSLRFDRLQGQGICLKKRPVQGTGSTSRLHSIYIEGSCLPMQQIERSLFLDCCILNPKTILHLHCIGHVRVRIFRSRIQV